MSNPLQPIPPRPTPPSWLTRAKSAVYRLARPFDGFLFRLVYASRFVAWRKAAGDAPSFDDRLELYQYLVEHEGLAGPVDYLEFGVFHGESLKWWADHNPAPESRFVGFDTFTGLPEEWETLPQGTFDVGGKLPAIDDLRVSYQVGLFQDTLRPFLMDTPLRRRTVIHIDSDLYSAALFVLATLAPRLKPGDVIIFDEIGSGYGVIHEFRALNDVSSAFGLQYRVLGGARAFRQAALEIR